MTLATVEQYEPQVARMQSDPTGGRLVAWADGMAAAHRIGAALCSTAFAPAHFKGKPDEAAAAILFGDEIGLSPTQSLRSIFVISGSPGLYAKVMVALVMSKGHEVWTKSSTDEQVVVCGRRAGSNHVEEVAWTTARARKAGYTSNKKYETDPQAMLYARAAGDVCRRIAPDALAGISATVEELELERTTAAPKTRVQRVRVESVTAEPEPELEQAQDIGDAPELITPEQLTKLHTCLGKVGMGKPEDKPKALRMYAVVTGREVTSSKQLTKYEAMRIIDRLEADEQGEPEPDFEEPS
jgi:hypothetical protein